MWILFAVGSSFFAGIHNISGTMLLFLILSGIETGHEVLRQGIFYVVERNAVCYNTH